jgi:alanine racemase
MNSPDTRWSWVEIDTSAVRHNVRAFRELIGSRTKLMCVVKADAYGHGATKLVPIMHASGADQFAVATVAEGIRLREAGISYPILLLSEPPMESVEKLVEYNIMPAVYTIPFALAYGECAAANGKVGGYHLAVETGMNRIGVMWNEVVEFRRQLDFHRGLSCEGTFTHFATADVVKDWDFELQYKHFMDAVASLREAGLDPGLVHCDNTPATILRPDTNNDMVRVGLGLYGLHPAEATVPRIDLQPVMSVRARVTRVIQPEIGAGVSYGMTYRVPRRNIQIATIPIGYADGLARELSDRMEVLAGGARCRQVGHICMDACMIAVDVNPARSMNPAKALRAGDVVTIIGRDGDDEITLDDMAELRGTISYEVACDFGLRLEKIYV